MVAKQIYREICERLAPLKDWLHIDLYNNQFDTEATENPLFVPCVLVEYLPVQWQQRGMGFQDVAQLGTLQIVLHIAYELYENTYAGSPEQSNAIQFFDFVEAITSAVSGMRGTDFDEMVRISTAYPSQYTNVHLSQVTFQCTVSQTIDSSKYLEALASIRIFKQDYPYPTNE